MMMYLVIEGEGKGKVNFEYRAAIPDQCLAFIGIVTMIIVIIIVMIIINVIIIMSVMFVVNVLLSATAFAIFQSISNAKPFQTCRG